MTKKEIIQLIHANETIDKYKELLSTIKTKGYFSHYISEEYWFPNIPEFKEYFEVLKKELIQARTETIESEQIINTTKCSHEVRLNYHSSFYNMNHCVLCGKKVSADNVISFKEATDRNNHTVTFDARYQWDDFESYEIKNGKTNDEVRKMIIEVLKNHNEDDEVDLVEEFSKLNLKNVKINRKKRREEKYILIIGGTNLEYVDQNKKIYISKQLESLSIDFFKYFISLLNTKVVVIDRTETIDKDDFKETEEYYSRVCFHDYTTLDYLETALYQVKDIPFQLIIDLSEIYDYEIKKNQVKQSFHDLNLEERFPNSFILRINELNNSSSLDKIKDTLVTNEHGREIPIVYKKSNSKECYYHLEGEEVKEKDFEEICCHVKKLLKK